MLAAARLSFVLLAGLPAQAVAQIGNFSDITGPTVTSSALVGGFLSLLGPSVVIPTEALPLDEGFTEPTRLVVNCVAASQPLVEGTGCGACFAGRLSYYGAELEAAIALYEAFHEVESAAGDVTARSLVRAVEAFNEVVETASPAFLADPPELFFAIHAVLEQMLRDAEGVEATLRRP